MELNEYIERNEDVYFLMYNSFNDLLDALMKSSNLYVYELKDRS